MSNLIDYISLVVFAYGAGVFTRRLEVSFAHKNGPAIGLWILCCIPMYAAVSAQLYHIWVLNHH